MIFLPRDSGRGGQEREYADRKRLLMQSVVDHAAVSSTSSKAVATLPGITILDV
jgi:hypothetical protein